MRATAFVVLVAGVALLAWKLGLFELRDRDALLAAIGRVRGLSLLVPGFVLLYAGAVTFGLPASPLTLAGGVLFGFWRGFLLNWVGATAGAVLAYLLAGVLCGDACRALLGRKAEAMEHLAGEHGFMATLRLRLIPIVPFSLLNFAASLFGVRRRDYVAATALGIVPGTAVYTYFAESLLQGAGGASRAALVRVSFAGGLLLALSFLPTLLRRRTRAGGRGGRQARGREG
ncbi:MAG: TVP38/TMEM64 family protein [Gemmatimonadaceae bacterium]|nr:TVP38/TMEM64 family protein [Gemmatimonadaceae bacterium]NUO95637.1 TVP38/TMEM64 family protein [Gemmatimonadaceae bacterium]NUP56590.1 TVP38/TMEM64 family protein [Gemmatimonadaceae bacterium]NUR33577.1 TVP38/TMEM64 family protein [Gemmatimonadaceae bacterium]